MVGIGAGRLTVALGSALAVCGSILGSALAGGLSGQEGDVRRKVIYPLDMDGGCGKLHKQYIAASGHSAFAATTIHYDIGPGHVCGASLNAGSKKAAEAQAMARCTAGIKKFKSAGEQPIVGPCFIHMSK